MNSSTSLSKSSGLHKRDKYSEFNPKLHTCSLGYFQSVLVGKKLYVDGGYIWYQINGTDYLAPNAFLRVLDLSKPFDIRDTSSIPLTPISRPDEVPETSGGDLWHYNGSLYLRYGYSELADMDYPGWNALVEDLFRTQWIMDFWKYDIAQNTWNPIQQDPLIEGTSEYVPRLRHALTVTVGGDNEQDQKKAYIISGVNDAMNNVSQIMLEYDFPTETWSSQPTNGDWWISGLSVHIPLGKGYILAFAGQRSPQNTLSQIEVYDLAAQKWLESQPATAADPRFGIPAPRENACAVVAQAKDGSSWNIYVYGGSNPGGTRGMYKDMWVLSIPSFTWHLVNFDEATEGLRPPGLELMACVLVDGESENREKTTGRKMVLYGGRNMPTGAEGEVCDSSGTHIFDLNTLQWEAVYDPAATNSTYQVPSIIYNHIGGDSNGNASRLPVDGFKNLAMSRDVDDLYKISSSTDDVHIRPNTPATGMGKLLGVAIGVPLAVLFISALIISLVCYKRRHKNEEEEFEKQPELEASLTPRLWWQRKRGIVTELSGKGAPQKSGKGLHELPGTESQKPQELQGSMEPSYNLPEMSSSGMLHPEMVQKEPAAQYPEMFQKGPAPQYQAQDMHHSQIQSLYSYPQTQSPHQQDQDNSSIDQTHSQYEPSPSYSTL